MYPNDCIIHDFIAAAEYGSGLSVHPTDAHTHTCTHLYMYITQWNVTKL